MSTEIKHGLFQMPQIMLNSDLHIYGNIELYIKCLQLQIMKLKELKNNIPESQDLNIKLDHHNVILSGESKTIDMLIEKDLVELDDSSDSIKDDEYDTINDDFVNIDLMDHMKIEKITS